MKAILNGASADVKEEGQRQTALAAVEDEPRQESTGLPTDKFKKSGGFKASFKPLAPAAAAAVVAAPVEEDLDGEAMDLDGEEMDLDGEEMDLDGEAMDDLDGQAMS